MFSSSRSNAKKSSDDVRDSHHHVDGVHIGGRDYGVVNDRDNQEKTTTSPKGKTSNAFSSTADSNKNTGFHQAAEEESKKKQEDDDNFCKQVKSHHNIGGVHIGGNNYGTITMSGQKNKRPSENSSQKPDKYGNIGGYHKQGDNFDDVHYGKY